MENKLTIIILDFMKAERVLKNVGFLQKQKVDFDFEIIVVDNSDNENNKKILQEGLEDAPRVKLIINEENTGYIKAHNDVLGSVKSPYIAIINPDVLLKEENSLQKMIAYLEENPDVGILGPKQINDDGKIALSARVFPKLYLQVARRTFFRHLPFLRKKVLHDEMKDIDCSKTQDVDWLQSSCTIVRRDLWNRLGGFNERYFLFMSDVELSFEAWKLGYRTVFFADTQVYADGKRLSEGGFLKFFISWTLRRHVWDSILYRLKYFFQKNPRKEFYRKNNS